MLHAIYQLFESERKGINDPEHCYPLPMLCGSRNRLTKRQSLRDSFARWSLDAALIGKMAKLGLAAWLRKGSGSKNGMLRDAI